MGGTSRAGELADADNNAGAPGRPRASDEMGLAISPSGWRTVRLARVKVTQENTNCYAAGVMLNLLWLQPRGARSLNYKVREGSKKIMSGRKHKRGNRQTKGTASKQVTRRLAVL